MSVPTFDVTTIGEAMLRLSVPDGQRLEMAGRLDLCPAGAEANLAAALARLERRCAWLSTLPTSPLGRRVANHLRAAGVDLRGVTWRQGGRMGTYYVEFAAPPRAIQVIYDRAGSAMAGSGPEDVAWEVMLDGRLLHLTGITPALSPTCRALVEEAVRRAKGAGIPISFDINYRERLWPEAEACEVLLPLIQEIELLFCGQNDARRLFGCTGTAEEMVRSLAEQSRARHVVLTLGDRGVMAWDGERILQAPARPVRIVDRLGAGDALATGVIHGWLDGDLARGLRDGTILAALALSQHEDAVVTTREEIERLAAATGEDIVR